MFSKRELENKPIGVSAWVFLRISPAPSRAVEIHQKPRNVDRYAVFQGTLCANSGSKTQHVTFIKLTTHVTV